MNKFDDFFESETKTCNIMVAGPSGVGKSTLLNAVFGKDLAKTGVGDAVTKENEWHRLEGKAVQIYDTVGLEPGKAEQQKQNIINDLDKLKNAKLEDRIHAVWYCTNSKGDRFVEFEREFVEWLYNRYGLPIFIIITKTTNKKVAEILKKDILERVKIDRMHVIPLLAKDDEVDAVDPPIKIPAFGVDKLIATSLENIPEDYRFALIASQNFDLSQKRREAERIVKDFEKSGVFGWIVRFIPVANSFETAAKINEMTNKITELYGIDISSLGRDSDNLIAQHIAIGIAGIIPLLNVALMWAAVGVIGEEVIDSAENAFKVIQDKQLVNECEKAKTFYTILKDKLNPEKLEKALMIAEKS